MPSHNAASWPEIAPSALWLVMLLLLLEVQQQPAAAKVLATSWAQSVPPLKATHRGPVVNSAKPRTPGLLSATTPSQVTGLPKPSPCVPDEANPGRPERLCRDEIRGKCITCSKPAWLLFPGQDPDVFGGGLEGWRAVARRHLDYRYTQGPPFESYDANNNCNVNQDMFVWMSAPNANRRTCQLDKPYKFAYFNIMNQLMAADPNLPYVHQLALQQCSAASFKRPNRGSYISIRDLDTNRTFYSGPLEPLFISTPAWQQTFRQAYNGSCGVGTYRQGNERYPYTQGRPDIFLAKGQSVPSSPVGLKDFCGLQGSTPEETQYTATTPPGAYQVMSNGQITLLSSDDVRASADISDKIVRLHDFYSLTVAESGYSFAINLDALRSRPGFKGTINLQYVVVTDGKGPPAGTIQAEDPVNTAIFCLHCLEQCTNYCTVRPGSSQWSDPCQFRPQTTQITPIPLPQYWTYTFRITLEGRG